MARISRIPGSSPNTDPSYASAKADFLKELKKLPNVTFLTKKQSKALFDNMEFPNDGCIAVPKTKNSRKKNPRKKNPSKKAKK